MPPIKNTSEKTAQPTSFPDEYYQDPFGINRYVIQEKELFSWRAPSKIERKRSRNEHLQLLLIVIFCVVVFVLLSEIAIAIVFTMLAGVYALLMASPPTQMECRVTTLGVKVDEKYYFWPDMSQFWMEEKNADRVLYLRVIFPALKIMKLVISAANEEQLRKIIGNYLLYKKPQQTQTQKLFKSLAEKLPVDLEFLQL